MSKYSTLTTRITHRSRRPTQRFTDFVINGTSLYEAIAGAGDFITPFLWTSAEQQSSYVDRLLLQAPADAPGERCSLYLCAECTDLGCGALTVKIEELDDAYVWRDFGVQSDNDLELDPHFGPFYFEKAAYQKTVTAAAHLSPHSTLEV